MHIATKKGGTSLSFCPTAFGGASALTCRVPACSKSHGRAQPVSHHYFDKQGDGALIRFGGEGWLRRNGMRKKLRHGDAVSIGGRGNDGGIRRLISLLIAAET